MTGHELAFTLVSAVVFISMVFFLRKKYPHRTAIGVLLCLISPSFGHFYLKTNMNWMVWAIFWAILRSINTTYKDDESVRLLIMHFLIGVISACVMVYRLSSFKKKAALEGINSEGKEIVLNNENFSLKRISSYFKSMFKSPEYLEAFYIPTKSPIKGKTVKITSATLNSVVELVPPDSHFMIMGYNANYAQVNYKNKLYRMPKDCIVECPDESSRENEEENRRVKPTDFKKEG